MKAITFPLLASSMFAVGCSTHHDLPSNERDGLLAFVPEAKQDRIDATRREAAEYREQVAIADRDLNEVRNLRDLADANCSTTEARLADATSRVHHARRHSDQEQVREAEALVIEINDARRLEHAKRAYYDDVATLAVKRKALVESRACLADARLELQKAEAVAQLDRPQAAEVDVPSYRAKVCQAVDRVEQSLLEAKVAERRVALRREMIDARRQEVPEAARLQPVEPIDQIFAASIDTGASEQADEARSKARAGEEEDREGGDRP
jgi:hypothetical protein